MRQSKRKLGWMRLTALLLVLSLLLSGCAGPGAVPSESPAPVETPSDTSGNESNASALPDALVITGDVSISEEESADEPMDTVFSEEELVLLERTGLAEEVTIDISDEEASAIRGAVAGMERAYVAGPGGSDPLVKNRDWNVYSSSIAREELSTKEATFYDRLDNLCMKYLSTSALDGIKGTDKNGNAYYATDSVQFSDLGLSKSQAMLVAYWFKFNHPQYYFLTNARAATSDSLHLYMYETMSDGEERAKITNELFDKLEGWVQDVASHAQSTYAKEFYANKLLSEENTYARQMIGDDRIDQSLYSSVLLGMTVCSGYALAFCAMMNALGVDTCVALSDTHAWNVVRFDDGKYYAVDVCWNDSDSYPPYSTNYLNAGEEIVSATNSRNESHTYCDDLAAWIPAIAKNSYVPADQEVPDVPKVPTSPVNVKVSEDADNWKVTWRKLTQADGYQVARFTDSTQKEVLFSKEVSAGEYSFPKNPPAGSELALEPDMTHYFGVRAYAESNGNRSYSNWSEFTITIPVEGSALQPGQLAAPGNIRLNRAYTKSAVITWDPVSGVTGYEANLYEDAEHSGEPKSMKISGKDMRLEPAEKGTTYYFTIRSVKEKDGQTVYSEWVDYAYTHQGRK